MVDISPMALLAGAGVRVHNPVDVLRWNADNLYLAELERRGVDITPTRVIDRGSDPSLRAVLAETGWHNYVVKPTVSSTGYETWFGAAPVTEQDAQRFAEQVARMAVLVQEFAAGVQSGELSFVFIDGAYMHTILKRAAANEFRVHIEHGGTVERIESSASAVAWARSVIEAWGAADWTYARVDAVPGTHGLVLMELELLDPELFFIHNPLAIESFIQRITA